MVSLNIVQENELKRLIDYEQATCRVEGDLVYRCAFPFRPENYLQAELLDAGMLTLKSDPVHGDVVCISSEGYSYFPNLQLQEIEKTKEKRHDVYLIQFSALGAAICVLFGFLLAILTMKIM